MLELADAQLSLNNKHLESIIFTFIHSHVLPVSQVDFFHIGCWNCA